MNPKTTKHLAHARASMARASAFVMAMSIVSACDTQPLSDGEEFTERSAPLAIQQLIQAVHAKKVARHDPSGSLSVATVIQKTNKVADGLALVLQAEPNTTPQSVAAGVAVWESLSAQQQASLLTGDNPQAIVVPTWAVAAVGLMALTYEVGKDYNLWGREPEPAPGDGESGEPPETEPPEILYGVNTTDLTYLTQLRYVTPNQFAVETLDDSGFDY